MLKQKNNLPKIIETSAILLVMDEKITQVGMKILERLFGKKVSIPGTDGKPVVIEPGPTVIKDVKHPERIGGGKGIHHPDSDANPT